MRLPAFALLTMALASLIGLNRFVLHSSAFGIMLGAGYVVGYGAMLGRRAFPAAAPALRVAAGSLLLLAALGTVSALVYRFINLQAAVVLALLALCPFGLQLVRQRYVLAADTTLAPSIPRAASRRSAMRLLLSVAAVALALTAAALLLESRTGEALRSPWAVVPASFFALVFLLNLVGAALALRLGEKERGRGYGLLVLLTALTLLVGLAVYRHGYGFDPFVHQATERLIERQGLVEPKPWYYLGQYGLVVVLAVVFNASVAVVDALLLPLLAAVAVPAVLLLALRAFSETLPDEPSRSAAFHSSRPASTQAVTLTALAVTALPLGWFINTTPQGLANLAFLALLAVTFSRPLAEHPETRGLAILLTATASLTHPLAGVAALTLLVVSYLPLRRGARALAVTAVVTVALAALLPALFLLQERQRPTVLPTVAAAPPVRDPSFDGWLYAEQRFNLALDAVYHYGFNLSLLVAALAAAGVFILYRRRALAARTPLLLTLAVLLADWLLLRRFVPFTYLIAYERAAFPDRLLDLAIFCLLPFAAVALLALFDRLRRAPAAVTLFAALLLAVLRTGGLYLSYPRFDGYAYGAGYSTSTYDLAAVRRVAELAGNRPYVVLSNQAVSAAALHELGFERYFTRRDGGPSEPIFFYPIPTGGPLYQYYLKMVYEEPSRRTVEEAMDLVGVNEAYFVLNRYWANSEALVDEARRSADEWWTVGDGAVYIFKYTKA